MTSSGVCMGARRIICVPTAQHSAASKISKGPLGLLPSAPSSCHNSSMTPTKAAPTPPHARRLRRSCQIRLPSTAEKIGMVVAQIGSAPAGNQGMATITRLFQITMLKYASSPSVRHSPRWHPQGLPLHP